MATSLLAEIGKTSRITLLEHLKARGSLSVKELTSLMKMSYMGVKKHCLDLQKQGYLQVRRRASIKGRPQLEYALTEKGEAFFTPRDFPLSTALLQASARLFGPNAPEKLLFIYFQEKGEWYAEKLHQQSLLEQVQLLASLRRKEGYYSSHQSDPEIALIDNQHPFQHLLAEYSSIRNLEHRMLEQVLGVRLRREELLQGVSYRCSFTLI